MKRLILFYCLLMSQLAISQIPRLMIPVDRGNEPVELARLDIDVEVVGNLYTTTYDLTFTNPNGRDIQGELSMPLSEGEEICRYALDINGKLREGVVVEKVKARQAFEAVVRQNIDPGIVNKTKGNFFKTKIYPIPGGGSKRVVLAVTGTLRGDDESLAYSLEMGEEMTVKTFRLNVDVIKDQSGLNRPKSHFGNLDFDSQREVYNLKFERNDYTFSEPLRFSVPRFVKSDYQLFTEELEGKTYFYLNAKAPSLSQKVKKPSRNITIYWDRSHSASNRDQARELELLSRYLTSISETKKVNFIGFNYRESAPVRFKIGQDASKLIAYIQSLQNDGATRIDQIHFDQNSDEILLFTDAVNTIGSADFPSFVKAPVYAISSGAGASYGALKQMAKTSGGEFVNLRIGVPKALEVLKYSQEKLISIDYDKKAIEELLPHTFGRIGDYVEIVGVLKNDLTTIDVNYGYGLKKSQSQSFVIEKSHSAKVARVWAMHKIAALEWNGEDHQEQVLELARKFNIVTRNSSLLVLDRVEDYVAHEITPPSELKDEYDRLMRLKTKEQERGPSFESIQTGNLQRFEKLTNWYDREVVTTQSRDKVQVTETDIEVELDLEVTEETVIEEIVFEEAPEEELELREEVYFNLHDAAPQEVASSSTKKKRKDDKVSSSVKILAWIPNAPYMVALRNASGQDLNSLYYRLKKEHQNRPSFYLQVADLYFKKGLADMAVQVLSNTVELDLENSELLKVVARRLLDEKKYELAISIYEEIKTLRPEEPQSYRDLALAYEANGQCQQALNTYQYLLDHRWERFDEIKEVVFNEFNALITEYRKDLDLSDVNPAYIKSMPLDVRVVIDWSSNDNDIDLWVVDPNGEKCFYSSPRTSIGGKISKDFTRGYGPEEFSLKSAKRGFYTVYVNYFSESRQTITGPVTVYATLFTNYGTKDQVTKRIALQLENGKQTEQIGQLEFVD